MSTYRSTLVAGVMGLLMVACGGGSSGTATVVDTSKMMVSIDSTFIKTVPVGNPTDFNIDIKDVGTVDIPNLDLLFDDGDRFLDKYTVKSAGSCKVDTGLPGLACGKLAKGGDLKFVVTAQPKSAGDFVLKFHIANNKTRLHEADDIEYEYSWSQTVTS